MRHPLRLVIHAPLRTELDYRVCLRGLQAALVVDQAKPFLGYQLLPSVKPRHGAGHVILRELARQLREGYSLMFCDVDRILTELQAIARSTCERHPRLADEIRADWNVIADAGDEDLIDIRTFERLPGGHLVAIVGARSDFSDLEAIRRLPTRGARQDARRMGKYQPPRSEQFWGVLFRFLLDKREADLAWTSFQRWVRAGRPDPLTAEPVA